MKNNIKLVTWIAAIAVSLTIAGPLSAKERGHKNKNRNSQVVVDAPGYSYGNQHRRNDRVVIVEPRRGDKHANKRRYKNERHYQNRRYGNDRRHYDNPRYYGPNRHYLKAKHKKQKRKIRQLRRLNNYYKFQRPIVIITRDVYR